MAGVVAAELTALLTMVVAAITSAATVAVITAVLYVDRSIRQSAGLPITAAARAPIGRSTTRPISCPAERPNGGGSSGGASGNAGDGHGGDKDGSNGGGSNRGSSDRAPDLAIGHSADNGGSKGPDRPMDHSTD